MKKTELIYRLNNLENNGFSIIFLAGILELNFYIDKRDNAICVTNAAGLIFIPCDCYENTKESIKYLVDKTFEVYPELNNQHFKIINN